MKQYKILILAIILISLFGCSKSQGEGITKSQKTQEDERNGKDMSDINLFDFENIGKAEEATKKHSLDDVILIYFDEWTFDDPFEPIAINIKDNKIYVNPSLSHFRFSTYDEEVQVEGAEHVIDILKKFNVQDWKKDYTFEDPDSYEDGYSWSLWLQFKDGTVEKHSGEGTDVKKLTPENFAAFRKELTNFVDENLIKE